MVGIVLVSHSAALAEGAAELARQMGGEDVRVEAAGGMEDGSIGTDAERVRTAIERALSDDGVLVLMDLGSALMSAEMAVEMLDSGARVVLSEAPLVEGAVAAAAAARGGLSLDRVGAEARGALAMKAGQLGAEEEVDIPGVDASALPAADAEARLPIVNDIGLHARPAALVVELAGRFDADLRLSKPGGPGPVSARSLTALMSLAARKGDVLLASASGSQAREALAALEALTAGGFGEGGSPPTVAAAPAPPAPREPPAAAPKPGERLRGVGASTGTAVGAARRLESVFGSPPAREAESQDAELSRLEQGRAGARAAIEADRANVERRSGAGEAAIFAAHLALLDDEALLERARAEIERGATAEAAWHAASALAAEEVRALGDPLLASRAIDIEDTGRRVIAAITGEESGGPREEGIVIAAELTPADAAGLDPQLIRGIATARGSATAHAAILARALGLPAVVGLGESLLAVAEGTPLLLDGGSGEVVVSPPEDALREARERAERDAERHAASRDRASEPAATLDGTRVEVAANLGGAGGADEAVALGADGVGLLRTEFLFLDRAELPSEDEQADTLAQIARALDGRPLIVRTLDVGADKPLPALPMEQEDNPFLGERGIRVGLRAPELLSTQLRAILRAASEHPLKLMFPMVATAEELDAALALLSRAREETGIRAPLETGIMVEVPAAALLAERLAERVDFFSIGTNDLAQYTMAAERGNARVASLLDGPQPALLRLVRETVAGAERHGCWVGVCGELAGDPAAALLFVGLGVRELSMAPSLIPEVKQALRSVSLADIRGAAERALSAADARTARELACEQLQGRW